MEADKGCGLEGVVGQRWGDVGQCGAEVGLGPQSDCPIMEAKKCCGAEVAVGRNGVMWGDVGLGPLSGRPVMEADKGCGAEVG